MKKCFYILFLFLSMPLWAQAQTRRASIPLQHGAHRIGNRTDADMERWRQHGLGQFIHWGVYAIPGGFGKVNAIPELPNGYARGKKCLKMPMIACTNSLTPLLSMQRHGPNRPGRWGRII